MPSRNGTAAQSRSAKKPSTSQAGLSQQRSRGQTRGTGTQASERRSGYTADSQRIATGRTATGSQRLTTTAGNSKSLFEGGKQSKGGATGEEGGDGVKADDIWNKFVSDDQNVVRAPTADSNISGVTRSSQRTGYSQGSGSQGSQRQSQIDEEEEEEEEESSDDDRTIYSDYYLPPEYDREEGTPGPRAEIVDSYEACSCFPNRSNKFLGSMLYDKITCQHTGLTGHTQPGVFKFNPYWNENMEEPRRLRKRDMKIARSKYVFGYPKPKFELVSESEEETDEDEYEDDSEDEGTDNLTHKADTPKTAKTEKARAEEDESDEDDDDYDSEYDSDSEDEDDEEDEDYIPYKLPEIGYPKTPSLPPSSQSFRSRYSDFTEYSESVTESLPSLPATRQLTAQTRRTGVTQRTQRTQFTLPSRKQDTKRSTRTAKSGKKSTKKAESIDSGYDDESGRRTIASRQSLPTGPIIGTSRTFQGKYYDPVTKQVMLYDIGTRPGQRIPDGNLEPLYKPPTADKTTPKSTNKIEPGLKPGTKGSKRSTTSQQSHHSVPKAAVLGAVFISNLLSKNKARKEAVEAGYSDEEDN